jgi:hypothetical protein
MIGCAKSVLASPQRVCAIDRIDFKRRERSGSGTRRNNLKGWPAAVKHEKRSASLHPLNDIPQAGAQLLGVYGFDCSFHVHLKMNFDRP